MKNLIDPQRAAEMRELVPSGDDTVCSMCGEYCVFKQRAGRKSAPSE